MKVMILYANAGNGHRRAAEALAEVCKKDERFTDILLVDSLKYTNKVFQELYANLYIEAVKKAPSLWAMAFDETDQPWIREKGRMLMHRINGLPLAKEIQKFNPDLCLCTHFMPADIISTMLREDLIRTDLGVVVTDYYVHASWLESYVSRFYVAKEESRQQLLALGFPQKRVVTSGIPVDPLFGEQYDRGALCEKHNLNPSKPMVLLSAGAFGVMSGSDMTHMLSGITAECQLVIICGNNKKLQAQVERHIAAEGVNNIDYHVLGFTTEMHEWMAMASLFIGKPGGLSSSECLALGLPMVIWNPIPGQEVFNSIYLLENGAAIAPNSISTLSFRIDELLKNPEKLERMSRCARDLSRGAAGRVIVDDAVEHLGEGVVKIHRSQKKVRSLI